MSQEALPVAEIAQNFIRQFVGKPVHLALLGGNALDGYLLSFDGHSLWVVIDGEDRFVPLSQVNEVVNPMRVAG